MLFRLLRPALFTLDSEVAHNLAIAGLKALPRKQPCRAGLATVKVAGLTFPNPVGVAPGLAVTGAAGLIAFYRQLRK